MTVMHPLRKGPLGRDILVDTNILVLFTVGSAEPRMIERHKRTNKFTVADYYLLLRVLRRFRSVVTTPNVLTEVSNLIDQVGGDLGSRLQKILAAAVEVMDEHYVPSKAACGAQEFPRLGLADSSILLAAQEGPTVLTDDLPLYLALQRRGSDAMNFNHLREQEWQ